MLSFDDLVYFTLASGALFVLFLFSGKILRATRLHFSSASIQRKITEARFKNADELRRLENSLRRRNDNLGGHVNLTRRDICNEIELISLRKKLELKHEIAVYLNTHLKSTDMTEDVMSEIKEITDKHL